MRRTPLKKLEGPFLVKLSEIMIEPGTHRVCPRVVLMSFFKMAKSIAVRLSSMCAATLVDLVKLSNSDLESVAVM